MRQSRPIKPSGVYYISDHNAEGPVGKSPKICCCREWGCKEFLCSIVILAVIASVASVVVAGVALQRVNYNLMPNAYDEAQALVASDLSVQITANEAISITVPNDLLDHVGRTYTVYSTTAFAHTLEISTVGPLTTSWDGVNKKATLGGAVGDGLTFVVIDRDKIVVTSNTNVAFSP